MIVNYSKVKKIIENLINRLSSHSFISDEGVMLNNLKTSLVTPAHEEDNDEEWLIAKHRILDGRIKFRNLMESINKGCTNNPTA